MKNKILIIYIATGKYNKMWQGFRDSVKNFCPNTEKDIVVFTDADWTYVIEDEYKDNVRVLGTVYIPHQPWPLVALMKFHYIYTGYLKASDLELYTHVFYFNSNIEFIKPVMEDEILSTNAIAAVNCGWDYLGHDPLKFTYGKPVDPKSKAHIPTNDYTYVQSSMMGGNVINYMSLVRQCMDWTEHDLAHNLIPCFHDESYWNRAVYENTELVTILDGDYNMCKTNMVKWGHPEAKIVMRDSSITQYEYKDKFHENH